MVEGDRKDEPVGSLLVMNQLFKMVLLVVLSKASWVVSWLVLSFDVLTSLVEKT